MRTLRHALVALSVGLAACGGAGGAVDAPGPLAPHPGPHRDDRRPAEPDRPEEARAARVTRVERVVEIADGDADGVTDTADLCPGDPEDRDGDRDDDGCPESSIADAPTVP